MKKEIVVNHLTLTTGHMSIITKDSVDKDSLFPMKRIRNDALKENGVDIVDGITFKMVEEADYYYGTLYNNDMPILLTIGTKSRNMDLWEVIIEKCRDFTAEFIPQFPPEAPYICDILLPGIVKRMDILYWTGDFTKRIAWLELLCEK